MTELIPLTVLVPFAAAVLLAAGGSLPRRLLDVVSVLAATALAVVSGALSAAVAGQGALVYRIGSLPLPAGMTLVVDGFSSLMLVTVNVLGALAVLYSTAFLDRSGGKGRYYVLLFAMLTGLNGTIIAGDFFNAFVFLETTVLSAYVLASFDRGAVNFEAAFKYATLGAFSSMLVLMSVALIYAKTSTLGFADIARSLAGADPAFIALVSLLLIAGLGLKSTLVPFHAWVPDAYSSAPAPVSALYAGAVSKVAGIYLMARIFFNVFGAPAVTLKVLAALGALSIGVGVTLALYQWDFKRLLAYHSISQIGYVMVGLGLGTPLGILGGLFHLVNHSVFKSLLFLNAGSVEYATGTRTLKEMGGLAKPLPVTGATSMVASLSISGVPPLNGFWSKLIIILACVAAKQYVLAVVAALASILTLASFLKVQRYAFGGYLKDAWAELKEAPLAMTIPMIVLAVLCIFMGILLLPGIDDSFLGPALRSLQAGTGYADSVMGGGQ